MDALLTAIVIWLSSNYALPDRFDPPRIERVPSIEMASLRYKSLLPTRQREISVIQTQEASVEKMRDIVGVYNDQTRTIYLSDKWGGTAPAELSVLVHEMVHHLQNMAELKFECPMAREKLAYLAQDKWLGQFGMSLENDFDVDMFTVVISSACM